MAGTRLAEEEVPRNGGKVLRALVSGSARRPGHIPAGQHMEVQMGHGLLSGLADVGDHAVTGLGKAQLLRQLGDDLKDMGHHSTVFLRNSGDGGDVGLGYHQEMGGCLGSDVIEGVAHIVLVDLAAGDLTGDDFTE